jgi:hypothetical protein
MMDKGAQAAARDLSKVSQSGQAGILRGRDLRGSQPPGEVSLGGGMPCAEGAFLFRLGSAHRALDGQYVPQSEFGFHTAIIRCR